MSTGGREDERSCGVLDRTHRISVKGSQVGRLSNLEGSDLTIEAKGTRTLDGRQLESLLRARGLTGTQLDALRQDRKARLLENVHAIVAGHRVRSEADDNAGGHELGQRCDAMTQLRIRDR